MIKPDFRGRTAIMARGRKTPAGASSHRRALDKGANKENEDDSSSLSSLSPGSSLGSPETKRVAVKGKKVVKERYSILNFLRLPGSEPSSPSTPGNFKTPEPPPKPKIKQHQISDLIRKLSNHMGEKLGINHIIAEKVLPKSGQGDKLRPIFEALQLLLVSAKSGQEITLPIYIIRMEDSSPQREEEGGSESERERVEKEPAAAVGPPSPSEPGGRASPRPPPPSPAPQ